MTTHKMPAMPAMGRGKAIRECACGCGAPTKATWHPGHDGRATGWAIRIERGMGWEQIPENERAGAAIMTARRANANAKANAATKATQAA